MKPQRLLIFSLLCIMVLSCVEPYMPKDIPTNPAYLVINGSFNASNGSAVINLSRSIALSSNETPPVVSQALVSIQEENGPDFQLNESEPGVYTSPSVAADPSKKYRLRILTGGAEYLSDYVVVKQTPDMEELTFNVKPDEVEIVVNTTDNTGDNRYFRWTYHETWEYTSSYASGYYLENGEAVTRNFDEQIYRCWRTVPAYKIAVGTSEENTTSSIRNFVLQSIDRGSFKLSFLYSIKVEQMALTQEAYTYWLNLKKTSENLGGLFDPMPGQVTGNIRRTDNPSEPVIGYFSASTVSEKRIFVANRDLPADYANFRTPICQIDTLFLDELPNYPDGYVLLYAVVPPGAPNPIGYTATDLFCTDCRLSGKGVSVKPDFWP